MQTHNAVEALAALPLPEEHNERVGALERLLGLPACRQLGLYPIPPDLKVSVVIPVFNEERWLREVIRRVQETPFPKEIILVDDCSTDGTADILRSYNDPDIRVIWHAKNQGKGAALRTGFQHVT
ncbi:MAG TPA: glycosyltransferase family 2 protein, partial [Gemmatales bacterium]|nr:glycosyltransferase family 2 protein [Gemmatales bacterium]